MAVAMSGFLFNQTNVRLKHGPSSVEIETAPPADNGGDGSSFSPTDLCAASLAACTTTIMALFAKRNNIAIKGAQFSLEKEMLASPRKIGKITLTYNIETSCSDADFERIVAAGKSCPVRLTLGDDVEIAETYFRSVK